MENEKQQYPTPLKNSEFYTDVNVINLPIFSASKSITSKNEKDEIVLEKNSVTTKLIISYPGKKLTFFDRKILASIEYLYAHRFNFDVIKEKVKDEIEKQKSKFLERFKRFKNKEENLSEAARQQIIVEAMEIVQREFKLYLSLKDISEVLFDANYLHTKIRESLIKLSSTKILQKSSYLVDGSKLEVSTSLINLTISREKNADNIIISLGSFHLFNILQKNKIFKSDLSLLNSFNSQIAGRLSELIKKSLYGSKKFLRNKTNFPYSYICNFLQIKQRKSYALIKQQLEAPFRELIEKQIISNYLIEKDLFEYTISFYYSYGFYEEYWNLLDATTKRQVNRGLNLLSNMFPDDYADFKNAIKQFMESTNITDSKTFKRVESFYSKYYFLNNYTIDEFKE